MCVTSGLHALPLSPSRSLVRRSPLGALWKKEKEGEQQEMEGETKFATYPSRLKNESFAY